MVGTSPEEETTLFLSQPPCADIKERLEMIEINSKVKHINEFRFRNIIYSKWSKEQNFFKLVVTLVAKI
jgi:hypothetical protein